MENGLNPAPHRRKLHSPASSEFSTAGKDRGTTFPYLSELSTFKKDRGTTCRDHNIRSINTPTPINNISSIANSVPEDGEEGGGIFSKREKAEEEIQDIIGNLAKHGVKSKKIARELAKKYATSFIYRHIMQINRDHRACQRWRDPGGILVARIRKEESPPDFKAEDYPESIYVQRFGGGRVELPREPRL